MFNENLYKIIEDQYISFKTEERIKKNNKFISFFCNAKRKINKIILNKRITGKEMFYTTLTLLIINMFASIFSMIFQYKIIQIVSQLSTVLIPMILFLFFFILQKKYDNNKMLVKKETEKISRKELIKEIENNRSFMNDLANKDSLRLVLDSLFYNYKDFIKKTNSITNGENVIKNKDLLSILNIIKDESKLETIKIKISILSDEKFKNKQITLCDIKKIIKEIFNNDVSDFKEHIKEKEVVYADFL